MPNLKISTLHFLPFTIITFFFLIKAAQNQCSFPFQRCICSSSAPFCPCASITSAQTLNSSYFSHLVLVNGFGCRPCPPKCRRCSSLQICTECFDEYELLSSLCEQCPINCKKCRLGVCQQCIQEYYIDYQQKCQRCPLPGTKTCTIDSLRSCQSNFWLDNNGAECVNCDANCRTCSSTTKCTRCVDGYFENNFQCSMCRDECRTCLNNSTCIDCKLQGYFFNSTAGTCLPCSSSNCQSCLNNGICTLCSTDNGFYLDKTLRTCLTINSIKWPVTKNCRNLTYTQNASDYVCELCKDGYYALSEFSNASSLVCNYGCSILCSRCTGAHYGLCDTCVQDTEFSLVNRHCIPRLNLDDGTAFQTFFTAFSNSSYFGAPRLILPDSCWHEHVKGGASSVTVRLSRLGVYKIKLSWKIYKYSFTNNNTFSSNESYSIQINNTMVQKSPNQSFGQSMIPFTCQQRAGFSALCASGSLRQCIDKNEIIFEGIITSDQNLITFSSSNSLIAISQLLLIGYRCGGLYGDGCIECSEINTCTKCDNPTYYIIAEKCIAKCPRSHYTFEEMKKCVEICPVGSYPDDALHQCFSCKTPCETCVSDTECITCRDGFFYSSITLKCQSSCPARYYQDSYRRICEKCTSPCLECIDNIRCISCREGFLRVYPDQTSSQSPSALLGDCVLQCPDGQYTDLATMRCQKCISPCLGCSMLADTCTTCVSGYYLFEAKCLGQCPEGYFNNQTTSRCERCTSSCEQCLNLTHCTQCQMGFYLTTGNTCISTCPAGFYQEQILKQCLPCSQNCSTCKSNTICSTCISGFSYLEQDYSCGQKCPQFYYPLIQSPANLSVCSRCQLPCYDCANETYCLSCYDAFLFNGACMIACPSGFYANLTALTCLQCDLAKCLQCKNVPIQCTKCNASLLLVNQQCMQSCPYGFYFSQYKAECVLCSGLCSSCLNATFCLSCIKGFALDNVTGLCLSTCQTGLYQVVNTAAGSFECFPCDKNCQVCSYNLTLNKSQCITCLTTYFLTPKGFCLNVCPDGFYGIFGKCEKCLSPCSLCTDQDYCLKCLNGLGHVYQGACVNECPYGYFENDGKCLKCDSTCLTCSDNATQCTVCQTNLFLLAQFSNISANLSVSQFKSMCLSSCPYRHTQVNQQCLKCAPSCKTCGVDYQQCTSCESGLVLFQARCVSRCPISHYLSSTSKNCITCGPLCQSCLNSTFCLNCHMNYSLTSSSQCVSQCSSGEYSYDGVCRKCMHPCGNCTDSDTCLSCMVGIFFDGQCIDECPQGTFYEKIHNLSYCIKCTQNCSRCFSTTQCLFCSIGYLFNSSCLSQCPDGFFPNYGACMQCQQNCGRCENSYSCTSCVNGSLLFQSKCIRFCPIGYYELSLPNIDSRVTEAMCRSCDVQCAKCFASSNQCMQCNKGYYLYIDKCINSCPEGTYAEPKFRVCEPCISPCETCSNAYSCGTCIYGYLLYRQASRNQCVQGPSCPNNYYLNIEESICEFECPQRFYVSNSTRICSSKCAKGLVTYEANRSCLEVCPQEMWIDEKLSCQSALTRPQNLPQLKCQVLLVRNLFFLKCQVNLFVDNVNQLTIEDFTVSLGEVTMIKVKSNTLFYLLVQNIQQTIRSEHITVELTNKYKLLSSSFATQGNSQNRLFQQLTLYSYPVQNYRIPVYVQEYIPFTIEQRQVGMNFYQIGQAISFAALVLWFFSVVKNLKSTSLLFIINLQWLYGLSLLSSNDSFPPNLNQFLQSFKFSSIIDIIEQSFNFGQDKDSLWALSQIQKDKFWAIHDFYSFQSSLIGVYVFFSIFIGLYLILYSLKKVFEWLSQRAEQREKLEEEIKMLQDAEHNQNPLKGTTKSIAKSQSIHSNSQKPKSVKNISSNSTKKIEKNDGKDEKQSQMSSESRESEKSKTWSDIYMKISKKSDILRERFHFNYLYQVILLTLNAICLCTNIQLTRPSSIGLGQTICFILLYSVFLSISFYIYYQSQKNPEYKSRKALRSTAFFFIYFMQIIVQNVVIIWTSFYFFVGFGFVCIVVNIIAWNWIYRKSEPQRCSYLQLIEMGKGAVLVMVLVGSIKKEKWSSEEIYMFGFAQIAGAFFLILLSSVSMAQELFSDDTLQKMSIKNNSSAKYQILKKTQKKDDNAEEQHEETSGFEDDAELDQEESFFSNKTPVESDSESSEGDLIDFDESVQSENKKKGFGRNEQQKYENPPKNLFRYEKGSDIE